MLKNIWIYIVNCRRDMRNLPSASQSVRWTEIYCWPWMRMTLPAVLEWNARSLRKGWIKIRHCNSHLLCSFYFRTSHICQLSGPDIFKLSLFPWNNFGAFLDFKGMSKIWRLRLTTHHVIQLGSVIGCRKLLLSTDNIPTASLKMTLTKTSWCKWLTKI